MSETGKLEAIFDAALGLAPEDRDLFLARACGSDAELRRRVERLLKAHDRAGNFLTRSEATKAPPGAGHTANPPPAGQPDIESVPTRIESTPIEGPGSVIGRYKLLQHIGEGGFGVVYMAEQKEPVKRRVALKIIKLGMDTKQVVARFEAERQALALMDHPNIAKILDGGMTGGESEISNSQAQIPESSAQSEISNCKSQIPGGRPYFVMELVKGIPITKFCDENNLSTKDRLELFSTVCHAIQHAHQKGIIHRDVKPSNILVTLHDGKPVPKVIDFGIAKATQQELTEKTIFTQFQQMIGTPAYMSPEQAEMSGLDIDTRTDIYSLGVLLYELLTGKTPLDAKILLSGGYDEIRRRIKEEEPPRPSTRVSTMAGDELTANARHRNVDPRRFAAELRGDLDWIVMKALEKDRQRRYDNANNLADDIQRHLNNEAVLARPPSTAYKFQKLVRRNKLAFAAAGAVAAAVVIGLSVATISFFRERAAHADADRARRAETAAREQVETALTQAETAAAKAKRSEAEQRANVIRQYVANGNRLAQDGAILSAMPYWLEALRLETDPARAEMHRIRLSTGLRQSPKPRRVWFHREEVLDVAFSPDDTLVASGSRDRTARVWNLETGEPVTPWLAHSNKVEQVLFSHNGRWLLTRESERAPLVPEARDQGEGAVNVWRVTDGQLVFRLPHTNVVSYAEFSADDQLLAAACSDGIARVWRVSDHALLREFAQSNDVAHVAFSPDGTMIVTASKDGSVLLWSVASGERLKTWDLAAITMQTQHWKAQAKFSPNGRRVLAFNADRARVWDITNTVPAFTLGSGNFGFTSVEWAPDGSRILTADLGTEVQTWNAPTGSTQFSFRVATEVVNNRGDFLAAFSENGNWVVTSARDGARVWDPGGLPVPIILPECGGVTRARLSFEGRHLLLACGDGTARVWDLFSTEEGKPWIAHSRGLTEVRFSADGKRLFTLCNDASVGFWNVENGRPLLEEFPQHQAGPWGVRSSALSPDDRFVFAADQNGNARVYDARTGLSAGPFLRHGPTNEAWGAFTPDSKHVLTGDQSGTLRLWNYADGTVVRELARAHDRRITGVLLVPQKHLFATAATDKTVRLWKVDTLESMGQLPHEGEPSIFSVSPDGALLASGSRTANSVMMWKVDDQALVHRWTTPQRVEKVVFDPSGERVAAVCGDFFVRAWDVRTGSNSLTLPAGNLSRGLSFSPDGRLLAAGGSFGGAVWDAKTGEAASPVLRGSWNIWWLNDARFSPDSQKVAGASGHLARIWDLHPEPFTLEQWRVICDALSGQHLIPSGDLVTLSSATFSNTWHTARRQFPALFENSEEQLAHRLFFHANGTDSARAWRTALPYLDRLIAKNSADDFWKKRRGIAWLRLGDLKRAAADDPLYQMLPRDTRASPQQIDLSTHYNVLVTKGGFGRGEYDLSSLPNGLQNFAGTLFDVRGLIELSGVPPALGGEGITRVAGIPVGQRCRSLNFLHATKDNDYPDGRRIGSYVLHYADGEARQLPIVVGEDLNCWWKAAQYPATGNASKAVVAWTGTHPFVTSWQNATLQLFKRTYENPRPDVMITEIDFASEEDGSLPFLVALTVE